MPFHSTLHPFFRCATGWSKGTVNCNFFLSDPKISKSVITHWFLESSWGHSLRSIPFVMSGHLIFNFFQTLGLPIFNTNPNNGCPKRIYQHSGQAHKHFSHRFHGVSFLADVQTWRSKQKFVFIATNPPQYQNFCTQCTKIITMTLQDSSHLFYPPCINACPTMTLCPTMTFLSPLYVFTPIGHLRPLNFVQSSS